MDLHLSKEQEMLRKMYRDFAENEVKPSPWLSGWTRTKRSPRRPSRRWPSWA